MKTILMIGDSWGVPNYEGLPGDPPETHSEFRFRELGYKVYNCSMNARGNLAPLDLAKKYLSGETVILEPIQLYNESRSQGLPKVIDIVNPKIDYIIWFHTESMRELQNKKVTLNENIKNAACETYIMMKNFFKEHPLAKKVVIGGQAPIVADIYDKFLSPHVDYIIMDWRSEILGVEMPEVHTLTHTHWVDDSPDTTEFKLDLLEKHDIILKAMADSPYFPDNCHPGGIAHGKLVDRLHKFFQEN